MRWVNLEFFSEKCFVRSKMILHRGFTRSSAVTLSTDTAVQFYSVPIRSILVLQWNELYKLVHTLYSWFSRIEYVKYQASYWVSYQFLSRFCLSTDHYRRISFARLRNESLPQDTLPESQKERDWHPYHEMNKTMRVSKVIQISELWCTIFSVRFLGWRY